MTINGPRYQLSVTLSQLDRLKALLEIDSASEADPDAEVFELLDLVRQVRADAIRFKQRNQERAGEVLGRLTERQSATDGTFGVV